MNKKATPYKNKRISVPLNKDVHEMLDELSNMLKVSKSSLIQDVLNESLPELYSMVKQAEKLKEEGLEGDVVPIVVGSIFHKLGEFFSSLSGEESKKK